MSTPVVHASVLAVLITCLPGCSLLIANSGTTLRDLNSRQIVQDRFGPPDSITEVELIAPHSKETRRFEVDNYHIHANFDTSFPVGSWHPLAIVVEPYLTCHAIYEVAKEYVDGHHLAFVYDEEGNTIGYRYPQPFLEAMHIRSREGREGNVLTWEESSKDAGR